MSGSHNKEVITAPVHLKRQKISTEEARGAERICGYVGVEIIGGWRKLQ
jgi:hypothetical protein